MLGYSPYQFIVNFRNRNIMSCSECVKLGRMVKVLESDHEFQLRKLSEDKSTERALFQVSIQKEVRRWQERYHKEKQEHEENGKLWLNKIDSITETSSVKVAQTEKKYQSLLAQQKHRLETELKRYKDTTEQNYQRQMKKMADVHKSEVSDMANSHASSLQFVKNQHRKEVVRLQQGFNDREAKFRIDYQSNLLGLRSEKNSDERSFKKIQEDLKQEKTRLITEIYELKSKICDLEMTVRDLKQTVVSKDSLIQAKLQTIAKMEVAFRDETLAVNQKHDKVVEELYDQMDDRIKQFYENELVLTDKYERTIARIEQNRQIELSLYENNMKQIKNCIESRPSRLEDVEQILSLREKLSKKQKEADGLERELRNYQLQLQNKEDTYNKIFVPTINSNHLNPDPSIIKRKEIKMKRTVGKSISSVREILHSINLNPNNLPLLNSNDKKFLPPRNTKIL